MNELRVGLFTDNFTPVIDGVTLTVQNYAYWLEQQAGRSYVVAPRFPGHEDRESYPVVRYFSLPLVSRRPYRIGIPGLDPSLRSFLRSEDTAIVHAHTPFGAGRIAARTASEKRIPLVATFHSKYRDDFARAIGVKAIVDDLVRRIADFYNSADFVWVPQRGMAATLREYGYDGPCEVMENGIDLKPPVDPGPERGRGAAHLGMPESLLVGLFVGQHILEKNLEFLLRSLPRIMEALPEFRMVLVGEGYAKPRLRRLASELGIAERTTFHEGIYDRELLASIYARGDLLLFPSLYDNAPLTLREAAAFCTPALLLAGSTAAEVIEDGRNGFLAENSLEAFSETAIAILRDQSFRETAGKGARESLCASWEDVVVKAHARYVDILSRWRR